MEQRTGLEAGGWGGLLSLGAKARGIAGAIVEGPARDIDQSIELAFPVFARSLTALTARGRISEQATNVPVKIGELIVSPGDYVIADRSAVIIISQVEIGCVLAAAERIAAKEEEMAKQIRAGRPIGTVMGGNYEQLLKPLDFRFRIVSLRLGGVAVGTLALDKDAPACRVVQTVRQHRRNPDPIRTAHKHVHI